MEEAKTKESSPSNNTVLVTGASGFIAGHIIKELLKRNYKVRGTVRSLKNKETKYKYLYDLDKTSKNITLVQADLNNKNGWDEIIKGCDYVIHTANPMPNLDAKIQPTSEEAIQPSINGMKYVFNAIVNNKNKVKKVVYTSSVAAMDWSNCKVNTQTNVAYCYNNMYTNDKDPLIEDYAKSKVLAEKCGWELSKKYNIPFTTIHPCFTIGPLLTNRKPDSSIAIFALMNGLYPRLPKLNLGFVDVREVALAHVNAMEREISNGKRYILYNKSMWYSDLSKILIDYYGTNKYAISSCDAPFPLLKLLSYFDPLIKEYVLPMWNILRESDNTLSQKDLSIIYRPINQSIIDMANTLIQYGFVKEKSLVTKEDLLNWVNKAIKLGLIGFFGYLLYFYIKSK